eukprot:GHVU01007621.1.p1 GENE.GHVU01007621.1~~GHVU01007621.1.p1  ORF type:complete len:163 (+),score=13.23 GHVU01007621.1:244-732(+)
MNLFSLPMMTLVVSTLSLVITFHYYVNMLRLTRHLQQANTFNVIHSEYASPKTLEAMELIEDFIEDVGVDKYGFEFWQLRSQKKEKGRLLERARVRTCFHMLSYRSSLSCRHRVPIPFSHQVTVPSHFSALSRGSRWRSNCSSSGRLDCNEQDAAFQGPLED